MTDEAAPQELSQAAAVSVVDKFFGDITQTTQGDPGPDPAPDPKADPKPAEQPSPPKESLAEVIRKAREDREGSHRIAAEHTTLKTENEALKARVEALSRTSDDPIKDIVGWAKARKLSPETQSLLGQALLYDLVPDKAPPDFRVKLLEAKIAREKADEAATAEKTQRARAEQERQAQLNNYHQSMRAAVAGATAGSYPESDAWFGDDHDNRARSLMATANNMATVATKQGRAVDLSPGNVSAVLEAELAGRFKTYSQRRAAVPETQADSKAPGKPAAATNAGTTTSTKGLTGGQPRPPAKDDAERARRAAEVMFGPR